MSTICSILGEIPPRAPSSTCSEAKGQDLPADVIFRRHALQLRQAKLSFPSVHLLVGICSDELCQENKARAVLSHFERLESARHCRWVDQVVPEAPWILDTEFLEKYEIDYVAHDEQPYAGAGGAEDIYKFIKDLGVFFFPVAFNTFISLRLAY